MPPDIKTFVDALVSEAVRGGFKYAVVSDDVATAEMEKFRAAFGRDLPTTYVEICKLRDGFTDPDMARLHGLRTIYQPGAEFPDYEGLLGVYEQKLIDLGGREDFIEFGNRDGTEPWGWDLSLDCFIRSDPNELTGAHLARFDTFEDMFRALFKLGHKTGG